MQKCYIGGQGGYNSWNNGTYHVDTLGPTKPQGHTIMNSSVFFTGTHYLIGSQVEQDLRFMPLSVRILQNPDMLSLNQSVQENE